MFAQLWSGRKCHAFQHSDAKPRASVQYQHQNMLVTTETSNFACSQWLCCMHTDSTTLVVALQMHIAFKPSSLQLQAKTCKLASLDSTDTCQAALAITVCDVAGKRSQCTWCSAAGLQRSRCGVCSCTANVASSPPRPRLTSKAGDKSPPNKMMRPTAVA